MRNDKLTYGLIIGAVALITITVLGLLLYGFDDGVKRQVDGWFLSSEEVEARPGRYPLVVDEVGEMIREGTDPDSHQLYIELVRQMKNDFPNDQWAMLYFVQWDNYVYFLVQRPAPQGRNDVVQLWTYQFVYGSNGMWDFAASQCMATCE